MLERLLGRKVTMIVSYGGDYVAGKTYRVSVAEAERLIARGYAEGETTLTPDEVAELTELDQRVSVG